MRLQDYIQSLVGIQAVMPKIIRVQFPDRKIVKLCRDDLLFEESRAHLLKAHPDLGTYEIVGLGAGDTPVL